MTHEENRAILKFGDDVVAQLKQLARKSAFDSVGVYLALTVLQANLLKVQTQDTLQTVKEMGDAAVIADAEEIVNKGEGNGK